MNDDVEIDCTQWPAWYRGKELGHRDLAGLEHFLLSRSHIIDEEAFGIDLIEKYDETIKASKTGVGASTVWTICVRRLRAVAPSGAPVVIGEKPLVTEIVDLSVNEIDIWIRFRDATESALDKSNKLILVVEAAPKGRRVESGDTSLYLGRYQLNEDGGIKVKRRPRVRRFCAFGPIDQDWWNWVKDLQKRIDDLCSTYGKSVDDRLESRALASELLRLHLDWPFLPLPILTRSLRRIKWMIDNPGGNFWELVAALMQPLDESKFLGEELPNHLCGLLPEAVAPVSIMSTLEATPELLAMLSKGVEHHAPIGLLYAWYAELKQYQDKGVSGATLQHSRPNLEQINDWACAASLITNMVLDRDDSGLKTSAYLGELYNSISRTNAGAAPMAFYWLAKTAALLPNFPQVGDKSLISYFQKVRGAGGTNADRLARYIDRLAASPRRDVVDNYFESRTSARRSTGSTDICCVVLGNAGTGKTCLRDAMKECWSTLQGSAGRLDIFELTPAERPDMAKKVDLLIVTIAPEETDRWELGELKSAAIRISHNMADSAVAFAFTRADEYGVVELKDVRLARRGQRAGRSDSQWAEFLADGQTSSILQPKVRGTDMPTVSESRTNTLRRHLLSATKALWIEPAFNDRMLNGYLVTARSPVPAKDEYLAASKERSGVPQLLGDFLLRRRGGL